MRMARRRFAGPVARAPRTRVAAVALIAAGALSACGGGSPPASPAAAVFIDLVSSLPRSLDPADEQGVAFERVETSLTGTLVRPAGRPPGAATLAPPAAVVGFLASSWRRLADGDYVFELRRGVQSAYGHTLTGADVSFSFARELAGSAQARFLAAVARISLRDPVTVLAGGRVRVNVTAPSSLTLPVLADFRFGVLDSRAVRAHESAADPSAHAWLDDHLASYGAYALTQFEPASKLLLRANPHFWRPLAFKHLAIEAVGSISLRLADVAQAAASHTSELDSASFEVAAHTSGLRAQTLASSAVSTLVPDERFRPFASVAVRSALSLAIDRSAISRAAFDGLATPARSPLPDSFAPVAGVRQPSYAHDVALARTLLAGAGYPHGFTFVLGASLAVDPDAAAELGLLRSQLRAVGLRVTIRYVASAGELAALERSAGVAAVLETPAPAIASAAFAIAAAYLPASPENFEAYDSPALERLAGALTASSSAASATLQRALAIVAATYPVIPLVEIPAQLITQSQIGGYAAYATAATYYDQLSR